MNMRIEAVASLGWVKPVRPRAESVPRPSQALVPVAPVPPRDGTRFPERRTPEAALIAQLLAARDEVPQLREKRRAAPAEAIAAYAGTRAAILAGRGTSIAADVTG